MQKIDAHQHFWKINRGDYHWMDDSVADIRHDHLPNDLAPKLAHHAIDGTIVVQAAGTVAESKFLLSLAAQTPTIRGVVGWVDLAQPDARADLSDLARDPKFCGVRPMLQDIEDTDWILQEPVQANLATLVNLGLRFDALVTPRHLPNLLTIARNFPDLPIVIDHCAKPDFSQGKPMENWAQPMSELAACPNVYCKISGLANEVGAGWENSEPLEQVVRHVLAAFTPQRCMWGSDWPVLDLAGDYETWHRVANRVIADLSDPDRAAIFGGTAVAFYGL